MARITIEEAKALADQWKAMREEQDRAPSASYFHGASPHELIEMWETGKSVEGKRLTKREFGCLVEAWCEVFGDLPPRQNDDAEEQAASSTVAMVEPLPADDTMLRANEVVRLTGISHSTIKRMVSDGRFPKLFRIGIRAKGWLARDVRHFIETLDEQRRRARQ